MKTYQEMVREYQKRQRDTVVDTIATGLTYMDEIAVETGVLEETGLLTELTEAACGALPFVMIAATEGTKVVLGKKTGKSGMKDGGELRGRWTLLQKRLPPAILNSPSASLSCLDRKM